MISQLKAPIWLVTLIQGLLMGLVTIAPIFASEPQPMFSSLKQWNGFFGLAMLGLGLTIFILAVREMGSSMTTLAEPAAQGRLVTTGVFRLTRNPIYLAILVGAWGWAIFMMSSLSAIACIFLHLWLRYKISLEEKFLTQKYGSSYREYLTRTPRLIC